MPSPICSRRLIIASRVLAGFASLPYGVSARITGKGPCALLGRNTFADSRMPSGIITPTSRSTATSGGSGNTSISLCVARTGMTMTLVWNELEYDSSSLAAYHGARAVSTTSARLPAPTICHALRVPSLCCLAAQRVLYRAAESIDHEPNLSRHLLPSRYPRAVSHQPRAHRRQAICALLQW